MSSTTDAHKEKPVPAGDVTVRIAGKLFRCECLCNVFRHLDNDPNKYQCNGCGLTYESA